MTRKSGTHGAARPAARSAHPHSVAILETDALPPLPPDQPFVEGKGDTVDPDLRHRMISEAAYRMYEARGYSDGNDVDDWLVAEAEVDHLLRTPGDPDVTASH
jgi:Protein of unknown function (DUF2934)